LPGSHLWESLQEKPGARLCGAACAHTTCQETGEGRQTPPPPPDTHTGKSYLPRVPESSGKTWTVAGKSPNLGIRNPETGAGPASLAESMQQVTSLV